MKFNIVKIRTLSAFVLLCSLIAAGGCSQTEIAIAKAADEALTQLTANKSLSEQFVKDAKNNLDPSDPEYQRIQASYEVARDQYNDYVRSLEAAVKAGKTPSYSKDSLDQLSKVNTSFIATAAKGIDPTADRRGLQFDKAIVLPDFGATPSKLSLDARAILSKRLIADISWKPWSQIQ